jgi:hypothetical protein
MSREFITQIHSEDVAKSTGNTVSVDEDIYVIPSGKYLRVSRFTAGHEHSTSECRIELVWRVGGTDNLVAVMYAAGTTSQIALTRDFEGNGSSSLVIRLINGDKSGPLHMTGCWEGVLQ